MLGPEAASALRLTAQSALEYGLIDTILPEPFGGAHRNPGEAAQTVKEWLETSLAELLKLSGEELKEDRYAKFRKMGKITGV